jgi:hypothetical protein
MPPEADRIWLRNQRRNGAKDREVKGEFPRGFAGGAVGRSAVAVLKG